MANWWQGATFVGSGADAGSNASPKPWWESGNSSSKIGMDIVGGTNNNATYNPYGGQTYSTTQPRTQEPVDFGFDVEIPEGTYPSSHSGLAPWAQPYAEQYLKMLGELAPIGMEAWKNAVQAGPFDWRTSLEKNYNTYAQNYLAPARQTIRDFANQGRLDVRNYSNQGRRDARNVSSQQRRDAQNNYGKMSQALNKTTSKALDYLSAAGADQGNFLRRQLQEELRRATRGGNAALASRGLASNIGTAAPALYKDAFSNYSTNAAQNALTTAQNRASLQQQLGQNLAAARTGLGQNLMSSNSQLANMLAQTEQNALNTRTGIGSQAMQSRLGALQNYNDLASKLSLAMANQSNNERQLGLNALTSLFGGLSGVLGNSQISDWSNPLAPYELMLGGGF